MIVSIDGTIVPPEAASVSIFDRGFLYGDGIFEVLRTFSGVAVDGDVHLARLARSASELSLRVPSQLPAWLAAAITAAGAADHRVRLIVTRGPGALGARLATLPGGRTIIVVEPLPRAPAELSLAVVDFPLPRRAGAAHKPLAFLDHVIARELAAAAGADEAVRLDADGHVAEGATANIFAVIAGTVVTPPAIGILPGVTRARVLALAAAAGIPAHERALGLTELRSANELFVTSAARGIVAVTRLDGESRTAGPITQRLADAYSSWMRALI